MVKCPKCESGEHTYNPWLLYNEKISDFIQWKEVGVLFVIWTFAYAIGGLILSIPITMLIDFLMKLNGSIYYKNDDREPVIKYKQCSKGPCKYCAVIQ